MKDSEVVVVRCFSIRLHLANLRCDQNSKTSIKSNHHFVIRLKDVKKKLLHFVQDNHFLDRWQEELTYVLSRRIYKQFRPTI